MDIERKDWCFLIAAAYYYGDEDVNLLQDYSKALYYYEIACESKHSDGCYWAGVLYRNGQGVKSNKTQAKELFGKACDLGFQTGCDNYKEMINPTKKNSEKTLYDEFLRKNILMEHIFISTSLKAVAKTALFPPQFSRMNLSSFCKVCTKRPILSQRILKFSSQEK